MISEGSWTLLTLRMAAKVNPMNPYDVAARMRA
jgi:hypothetical protein